MIQNGTITYPPVSNPLLSWNPPTQFTRDLLLALLTTAIAYQAAAILIDLSLGLKRHGYCNVYDIQILFLVRNASPLAIAKSLFPRYFVRHLAHADAHADAHAESAAPRFNTFPPPSKHPRPLVLAKLFFLLAAVPALNISAIILAFRRNDIITFSEARISGLALGINPILNEPHDVEKISRNCCRYKFLVSDSEEPLAEFLECDGLLRGNASIRPNEATIRVNASDENVFVTMLSSTGTIEGYKRGHMVSQDVDVLKGTDLSKSYFIQHSVTKESAERLIDRGIDAIQKFFCAEDNLVSSGGEVSDLFEIGDDSHISVEKTIPCRIRADRSRDAEAQLVTILLQGVVLVNAENVKISEAIEENAAGMVVSSGKFFVADEVPLLLRRRTIASIPVMGILTLCLVALRLVVRSITRNDLSTGVGLMARHAVGLPLLDSMLVHKDVEVWYENGLIVQTQDRSTEERGIDDVETFNSRAGSSSG